MILAVAQGLVEPNSPALIAQACDGPPATWLSGRGTGAAYDSREGELRSRTWALMDDCYFNVCAVE